MPDIILILGVICTSAHIVIALGGIIAYYIRRQG
jgi:hypothetical protein